MPSHTPQEGWEKEFDTKFSTPHWEATGYNLKHVKSFFKDILSQEIQRAKEDAQSDLKRELLESCEKMKIPWSDIWNPSDPSGAKESAYNQALEDIKQLLR